MCLVAGGCAPQWHYDYDAALRQARRSSRGMVILYKDPLDTDSGRMRDILESPEAAARTQDKVLCALVPFYAPNRRFMSQYGVDSAPAIVVVHPDRTYHALSGVHDAAEVMRFLDAAKPPGSAPKLDSQVPRRVRFEYFNVYERARDTARRQNRRLLIVYKWWLDPRSTELIDRISKPPVTRFVSETVCCILDWDYVPNRRHAADFGARGYPALILVEPTGEHRVLEGVHTPEEIIRFLVTPTGRRDQKGG